MKQHILFGTLAAFSAVVVSVLAVGAPAQSTSQKKLEFPAASPPATVKQRIGLTDVEIEYGRPGVKGRKIYGELVPNGEVWRTGANTSTKITFSTDVKVGGQAVPAGAYALFTIPDSSEWTVILNKVTGGWGAYAYEEKNDLVRVKVKPVALPELVETLSLGFLGVRDDSATLAIDWEKTRVPVKIEVDLVGMLLPEIKTAMAAEGKKPYLQAAMFYYEHDLDLKQALTWIDEAVKETPDAPWIVYRKGLILAKSGDKKGAAAAAQQAMELADKKGGAVGAEYKRLSTALLASLK